MWAFKDALCDNKLSSLIIEGNPTEEELKEAFEKIVNSYNEAMGDEEQKLYFSIVKEIALTSIALDQIETIVDVLRKYYSPLNIPWIHFEPLAKELNRLLRTNFKFHEAGPEEFAELLRRCIARSKGMLINLQLKEIQAENLKKKLMGGGTPDREYFDNIMITISDDAGRDLFDNMTVFVFCERVRRLNEKRKRQNKKK